MFGDFEAGEIQGEGTSAETSGGIGNGGYPKITGTVMTTFGAKNYSNHQEVCSGSIIPIHNQATRHQGNDGRGKGNGLGIGNTGDPSPTITATDNHSVAHGSSVRRLTPRECERLQGFPDDWTKIAYRGRTADKCADAPRYHALGNSWAVPVVRWIGERIKEVDAWT